MPLSYCYGNDLGNNSRVPYWCLNFYDVIIGSKMVFFRVVQLQRKYVKYEKQLLDNIY